MGEKKKNSSNPKDLSINELQVLARKLKIEDWQDKNRKELVSAIEKIADYDPKKNKSRTLLVLHLEALKVSVNYGLSYSKRVKFGLL